MEKKIMIGEKECLIKSSAAIPRLYRMTFGEDIINEMNVLHEHVQKNGEFLPEHVTTLENLLYVMNRHADPETPDTIEEWFEQFNFTEVYGVLPEVIKIWNEENRRTSTAKKKNAQ